MEGIALAVQLLEAIVGLLLIVAVLRIFSIASTLTKILATLKELGALGVEIDKHRREEFEAMTDGQ